MKKRFIVLLEEFTEESDNKFKSFIKEKRLGWWHWMPNSWLITNPEGNLSAEEISDTIKKFYGPINNLVIELGPDGETWAGFGPSGKDKNMFSWIHKNWKD